MANVKITELPVTTAVTGTDVLPVVQSSITKQIAVSNFFTNPEIGGVASFADGTEAAPSITNTGDSNTGVWFPAADTFAVSTGGVEALRVNSSQAVSFAVAPVMSALTASTALALNASKEVVSVTNTGTGNNVLSASPTLTGTVGMAAATLSGNLTLSAGTANGVLYLDGSKVATSGSALTFDGSNFGGGVNVLVSDNKAIGFGSNAYWLGNSASGFVAGYINGSEQMRLTSTGLGIGTSSPTTKLYVTVSAASTACAAFFNTDTANGNGLYVKAGGANSGKYALAVENAAGTSLAYLDSSGNLGIGTSSPSVRLQLEQAANSAPVTLLRLNNSGTTGGGPGIASRISFTAGATALGYVQGSNFASGAAGLQFSGDGTNAQATLDSSGNLGLGVTPSAWNSALKAIQVGQGASVQGQTNSYSVVHLSGNAYLDSGGTYRYIGSEAAQRYRGYAGAHEWYTAPSGTAGNAISFTQALTLDASGNLLVGTTTNSGGTRLKSKVTAGTAGFEVTDEVQSDFIVTPLSGAVCRVGPSAGAMAFYSANTESARITSGGDLLVGTTTAGAGIAGVTSRMAVVAATANFGSVFVTDSAAYHDLLCWNKATSGDNQFIEFATEGTYTGRGSIDYNRAGGLVRYNTTSDYRAKDIIGPVQNPGATIDALKVYEGVMKGATQSRPMLIAHEAQEHAPYAVSGVKDEVNEDGTPKFQQMDVSSLVPLLLAEIQSLRARVAALEAA